MFDIIWKKLLAYSFNKVYATPERLEELRNSINAETWIGSHIETGNHASAVLKPLGDYEMISIRCVITNTKTMVDGTVRTSKVDYWNHKWL